MRGAARLRPPPERGEYRGPVRLGAASRPKRGRPPPPGTQGYGRAPLRACGRCAACRRRGAVRPQPAGAGGCAGRRGPVQLPEAAGGRAVRSWRWRKRWGGREAPRLGGGSANQCFPSAVSLNPALALSAAVSAELLPPSPLGFTDVSVNALVEVFVLGGKKGGCSQPKAELGLGSAGSGNRPPVTQPWLCRLRGGLAWTATQALPPARR